MREIVIVYTFPYYYSQKFYICIRKLDLVNDTLEELGTSKEYHRLRNLIKWILITLFFMTCVSWTFDFLLCIEVFNDIVRAIIIPIVLDYSIQMNTIMDIMFMLLLRFVNLTLFQLFCNKYLKVQII